MPRLRVALGVAFLLAQVVAIGYARFVPTRYFAWAPYDVISLYSIDVRLRDGGLDPEEVADRYRLPSFGRDNRSIHHVIAAVRQYEMTYGAGDGAEVVLRYTVNGGPEQTWRWPGP